MSTTATTSVKERVARYVEKDSEFSLYVGQEEVLRLEAIQLVAKAIRNMDDHDEFAAYRVQISDLLRGWKKPEPTSDPDDHGDPEWLANHQALSRFILENWQNAKAFCKTRS